MTTKYKIKIKSRNDVIKEEGSIAAASADFLPGSFVTVSGAEEVSGIEVAVNADDLAGDRPAVIAFERAELGDGVSVAYTQTGSRVKAYRCELGQEFNARVEAGAIALNDYMAYGTDGQLKVAASGDVAQFEAIEAGTAVAGDLFAVRVISTLTIA